MADKKPPGPPQPFRGLVRETSNHSGPASAQHARAGGKGEHGKRAGGPRCYIGGLYTNQTHKGATHDTRPIHIHNAPPAGRPDGDAPGNGRLGQRAGSRSKSRMAASSSSSYRHTPSTCSHGAARPGARAAGHRDGAGLPAPLTGQASRASITDRRVAISTSRLPPVAHGGDAGLLAGGQGFQFDSGGGHDGRRAIGPAQIGPVDIWPELLARHKPAGAALNVWALVRRNRAQPIAPEAHRLFRHAQLPGHFGHAADVGGGDFDCFHAFSLHQSIDINLPLYF